MGSADLCELCHMASELLKFWKMSDRAEVQIAEFRDEYQTAFRALNEEWISTYFVMEEADYKALDNPKEYILERGGRIFVALYNNEPVGVCAIIKMDDPDYDYELAKMAVSPAVQGKRIGWLLANTIIDEAKKMGARKLYLESNTSLKPAISLYRKLGFKEVTGRATPYQRADIQMELDLKQG